MDRLHDIEGELHLLSTEKGGRQTSAQSGYRPAHRLHDNYLTSGIHEYPDGGHIAPGETKIALVWLITPSVYPRSVWVGRVLDVCEGMHLVGQLAVTKVLNYALLGSPETHSPLWVEPQELAGAAHQSLSTPDSQSSVSVCIVGWTKGASPVRAIQAIREHSALGLAKAKDIVDSCLANHLPTVRVPTAAEASTLVSTLASVGFIAEVRLDG
jgi:hypothetical protein